MTTQNHPATEIATICRELPDWAQRAWERLFEMVQEFEPDVIVLTARKMPRICEGLRVHFGDRTLVISDLAVPFSSAFLSNARVAIVDDVVNFGSTLNHVESVVEKHTPAAVKLFSLARRASAATASISYAHPVPLNEKDYSGYVRTVPAAISHVCKPYDLAFPLLLGRYRIPFRSAAEIVESLRQDFDSQRLHIIPSPYANSPVHRVSLLFLEEENSGPRKLRLYFDDSIGVCSVVPMVLPHHVAEADMPITLPWIAALREQLNRCLDTGTGTDNSDAVSAVALFTSSLDWFWSSDVHTHLESLFDFGADQFSLADAKIIFGPKIETILTGLDTAKSAERLNGPVKMQSLIKSPFLDKFDVNQMVQIAVKRLNQNRVSISDAGIDCYSYLLAVVEALAELVGTEKPSEYKLRWPYSKDEIGQNPYLRLRIGPTIPDMVVICEQIHKLVTKSASVPPNFVRTLSVTLDALIDQGAIVPTFATYEGKTFRIYRRGEAPGQDVCDKVVFAWAACNKPLSVTRLAKILAVLSHSQKYHAVLESSARTRGLVAGAPKNAIGAEPDNIATYLRNTGQIQVVEK